MFILEAPRLPGGASGARGGPGGWEGSRGPGAQEEGAASADTLESLRRRFPLYSAPEVVVGVTGHGSGGGAGAVSRRDTERRREASEGKRRGVEGRVGQDEA